MHMSRLPSTSWLLASFRTHTFLRVFASLPVRLTGLGLPLGCERVAAIAIAFFGSYAASYQAGMVVVPPDSHFAVGDRGAVQRSCRAVHRVGEIGLPNARQATVPRGSLTSTFLCSRSLREVACHWASPIVGPFRFTSTQL
mmetsp:Transcript_835/g.1058  ORF Transcript_835/g.1058 Transcript_835/m.1058 type:complete len:141 (-) Transcript_835:709-1131(-)